MNKFLAILIGAMLMTTGCSTFVSNGPYETPVTSKVLREAVANNKNVDFQMTNKFVPTEVELAKAAQAKAAELRAAGIPPEAIGAAVEAVLKTVPTTLDVYPKILKAGSRECTTTLKITEPK